VDRKARLNCDTEFTVNQGPEATNRSPRSRSRPTTPLAVQAEITIVDGEQGKHLARRQGAAVRQALEWLRDR
jgi:hypothetical protein